jgi:hypothetical protein
MYEFIISSMQGKYHISFIYLIFNISVGVCFSLTKTNQSQPTLLLLLLLLLFLTAIGFSPRGSSLTPVQTSQYNNTHKRNSTDYNIRIGSSPTQYTVPTLIQYAYTSTIYLHKYHIPTHYKILTQIRYTHKIQYTNPNTIYLHKYNIPTQIYSIHTNTIYLQKYTLLIQAQYTYTNTLYVHKCSINTIYPHNTIYIHKYNTNTIYSHKQNIRTQIQYNTVYPHKYNVIFPHKYNIPTHTHVSEHLHVTSLIYTQHFTSHHFTSLIYLFIL